jgi:hypothetical protein
MLVTFLHPSDGVCDFAVTPRANADGLAMIDHFDRLVANQDLRSRPSRHLAEAGAPHVLRNKPREPGMARAMAANSGHDREERSVEHVVGDSDTPPELPRDLSRQRDESPRDLAHRRRIVALVGLRRVDQIVEVG